MLWTGENSRHVIPVVCDAVSMNLTAQNWISCISFLYGLQVSYSFSGLRVLYRINLRIKNVYKIRFSMYLEGVISNAFSASDLISLRPNHGWSDTNLFHKSPFLSWIAGSKKMLILFTKLTKLIPHPISFNHIRLLLFLRFYFNFFFSSPSSTFSNILKWFKCFYSARFSVYLHIFLASQVRTICV